MSQVGVVSVKGYPRVGSMNGSRGAAFVNAWEVTGRRGAAGRAGRRNVWRVAG